MASRRASVVALNFDGLTDSVTNLAGSLILVTLLLMGITTDYVRPAIVTPPPEERAEDQLADQPIDGLIREVEVLRGQVTAADAEIVRLEQELARLRIRARDLIDSADRSPQ